MTYVFLGLNSLLRSSNVPHPQNDFSENNESAARWPTACKTTRVEGGRNAESPPPPIKLKACTVLGRVMNARYVTSTTVRGRERSARMTSRMEKNKQTRTKKRIARKTRICVLLGKGDKLFYSTQSAQTEWSE